VADELDRLYGVPIDEFVAARTEAAKRLKKEGRADEAADLQALRKPTLAVWALNQAARREPGDVRALVRAAEQVRRDPAAGERDFRAALRDVAAEARRALEEGGHAATDATVQRLTTTARAAAATAPEQLVRGVLQDELEPTGFEVMAGAAPRAKATRAKQKPKPSAKEEAAAKRRRVEEARRELQEARDEARALDRDATSAERAAAQARKAADRAEAAVRRAEERLEAARGGG
jgi:hypothetical protein